MENLGVEISITTSQRLRITIITNIFFENLREKFKIQCHECRDDSRLTLRIHCIVEWAMTIFTTEKLQFTSGKTTTNPL